MKRKFVASAVVAGLALTLASNLWADTFGTGPEAFNINFVIVGNAGNTNDAGAGGGTADSPYGGVDYTFRMSTYEISQDMISRATNLGLSNVTAGAWSANLPAANITWYEAAAFVNWMNTTAGYQPAYNLTYDGAWSMSVWSSGQAWQLGGENLFRNKDSFYFLPSEDEWYKAAYHKNDGVTANYWDYATASNTTPNGIDFNGDTSFDAYFDGDNGFTPSVPTNVFDTGVASSYGTFGQNGNMVEWTESAGSGLTTVADANRVLRGGAFDDTAFFLTSAIRFTSAPTNQFNNIGFRVASAIPEPTASGLLLVSVAGCLFRRKRA